MVVVFAAIQPCHAQAPRPFASGPLVSDAIRFEFAIYYSEPPLRPPMAALEERLRAVQHAPRLVKSLPRKASEAVLFSVFNSAAQKDYHPPDLEMVHRFGRGLSRSQAEALQRSNEVLILDFAHPGTMAKSALRPALLLAEQVARDTNGLLWDQETREIFTPDEWHQRRIDSWQGDVPDVMKHTVIHAYHGDKQVRAITLGMVKFGLPDVVVDDFSWSSNDAVANLINVLAQAMVEGVAVTKPGTLDLDLGSIKHNSVRNSQVASLKPNAAAVAKLSLFQGKWGSGDPANRLLEIGFDRYPGPDHYARQDSMLTALFGSENSVRRARHTAELLAASNRARAKLAGLQKAFKQGLQPGEYIVVKAPFKTTDGGNEWMWVEVMSWTGDEIGGLLKNEPTAVPQLHAGQMVKVSQNQVFDYIRRDAIGREEGNETGKILIRQSEQK